MEATLAILEKLPRPKPPNIKGLQYYCALQYGSSITLTQLMHLTFLILASCMTLVIYELCSFLACHRVFCISMVRYMSMKSKGLLGLIPIVGDRLRFYFRVLYTLDKLNAIFG